MEYVGTGSEHITRPQNVSSRTAMTSVRCHGGDDSCSRRNIKHFRGGLTKLIAAGVRITAQHLRLDLANRGHFG